MIFKQEMIISEYIKILKINNSLVTRLNTSLRRLKKLKLTLTFIKILAMIM